MSKRRQKRRSPPKNGDPAPAVPLIKSLRNKIVENVAKAIGGIIVVVLLLAVLIATGPHLPEPIRDFLASFVPAQIRPPGPKNASYTVAVDANGCGYISTAFDAAREEGKTVRITPPTIAHRLEHTQICVGEITEEATTHAEILLKLLRQVPDCYSTDVKDGTIVVRVAPKPSLRRSNGTVTCKGPGIPVKTL